MRKVVVVIAALFLATFILKTPPVFGQSAATSTDSPSPGLLDVLQQLQSQVQILTSIVADLRSQLNQLKITYTFPRPLQKGMSGDDVEHLQELLKNFLAVYPGGGPTGYFGPLTEAAVKRFQFKNGIEPTGFVGPKTESKLRELEDGMASSSGGTPQFTPIDLSTVQDLQNIQDIGSLENNILNGIANGSAESASPPDLGSQAVGLSGGGSASPSSGSSAPPPPVPPVISSIQASSTSKTSETILWTTNEPATSNVYYSNNSTVSTTSTLASDASFITSHSLLLSNLNNKTYYYFVSSANSSGLVSTSTVLSFTPTH